MCAHVCTPKTSKTFRQCSGFRTFLNDDLYHIPSSNVIHFRFFGFWVATGVLATDLLHTKLVGKIVLKYAKFNLK